MCVLSHSLTILCLYWKFLFMSCSRYCSFTWHLHTTCVSVAGMCHNLGLSLKITHHREWRQHSNILSLSDNCVNDEYDDNLAVQLYSILGKKLFIFSRNWTFLWQNEDELMWEVDRHCVKRYKLLTLWTGSVSTESWQDLVSILLSHWVSCLVVCVCIDWLEQGPITLITAVVWLVSLFTTSLHWRCLHNFYFRL